MCLICIEYAKGKLATYEALDNLREMRPTMSEEHHDEVKEMLEGFIKEKLQKNIEMIKTKRQRLEANGWHFGTTEEFLRLTEEETKEIEKLLSTHSQIG